MSRAAVFNSILKTQFSKLKTHRAVTLSEYPPTVRV